MELQFALLVMLIILSAFFSGVETALMSVSPIKLRSLVKQKKRGAEALQKLKSNPHRLLITILVGNNLVNIGSAALATVLFTEMFGDTGVGIATGVMTFLILVFGEISPKTYCAQNAVSIALKVARPIDVLATILSPVVKFFELISRGVSKLLGTKEEKKLSEDELRTILTMGKEEGLLSKEAAEMMHNIMEFEGTKVTDIMTPKMNIETVDGSKTLKEVIDFVVRSPFSRFPVWKRERNRIIGILDVDDVLRYAKSGKLGKRVSSTVRKVFFVPESKEIDDLLVEFEGKDLPMAIVVDEYGHISGLVTIEDILEEIVGEIFDKSRRVSVHIKRLSDKVARVDGKTSVQEINKVLHLGLDEKKFNTIAGFIEGKLERIPRRGEKVAIKNAVIEITSVTPQGIKSVKVTKA